MKYVFLFFREEWGWEPTSAPANQCPFSSLPSLPPHSSLVPSFLPSILLIPQKLSGSKKLPRKDEEASYFGPGPALSLRLPFRQTQPRPRTPVSPVRSYSPWSLENGTLEAWWTMLVCMCICGYSRILQWQKLGETRRQANFIGFINLNPVLISGVKALCL